MSSSDASTGRVTLFVGTDKGLFRLVSDARRTRWTLDGPHIRGYRVIHTCRMPGAPATVYAAATHSVWGAHVYRSTDGGSTWEPLGDAPHHPPGRFQSSLKAIWFLAPSPDGRRLYAGIDPPGLFVSRDQGASWAPVDGLNEHPTRPAWEPSKGIFAVHSVYLDPVHEERIYAAVSAGGAFRSTDGGRTWQAANAGVRAEHLPKTAPEAGHNIHRLVMHPRLPDRLYRQCYNGTYRSDDAARSWVEITEGLPSDFGYAIAVDPDDPDTVFQIPEGGPEFRAPVDGRLRVYRSRDGGASWTSASDGLPQAHVYVTVLREALDTDGCDPCGVYFGTSGGQLFASNDAGDHWTQIADYLPRVLCVRAQGPGR
jgi:hypothetical protein